MAILKSIKAVVCCQNNIINIIFMICIKIILNMVILVLTKQQGRQVMMSDEMDYEKKRKAVSSWCISSTVGNSECFYEVLSSEHKAANSELYRVQVRLLSEVTTIDSDLSYFKKHDKEFDKTSNSIQVTVNHKKKLVMFGPKSSIIFLQKSRGLASYCMSKVIEWMQSNIDPDYECAYGSLSWVDAKEDESRDRRNAFYRNFGFTLEFYGDEGCRSGVFFVNKISDLNTHVNSDKISEHSVDMLLGEINDLNTTLRKVSDHNGGLVGSAASSSKLYAESTLRVRKIVNILIFSVVINAVFLYNLSII